MSICNHRIPTRYLNKTRCPRLDRAAVGQDSPFSPYLRQWIAYQAARHRDLLLNIHAAARVGLAPVTIGE